MTTILKNAHGVRIAEEDKRHGHHLAVGALCHCGEYLIVSRQWPTRRTTGKATP